MDLPVFHLDFLNNRVLIALIAVLHVVVNHGMAVGGIPLVAYLERMGTRTGEPGWDRLAFRVLSVFFVVTTTIGALTGVGIWLSAALVNPYAIGSLIRVFFWTWFTEWLVFVTEVALILAYYLTWKRWSGARKPRHVRLGTTLAVASWLTMALIVSILSFMMDPGSWQSDRTLLSGMFNPVYLPQLAFRTPLAMLLAGAFALVVVRWRASADDVTHAATRAIGRWMSAWAPVCLLGGLWYAAAVPDAMAGNLPVALLTQALAEWSRTASWVLVGVVVAIVAVGLHAAARPRSLTRLEVVAASVLAIALIGVFERVREFIRKPYAIAGYLYSNGYRVQDYPILQRDGLLAHATYTRTRVISPETEVDAGREVFRLACTRCHTVDGINGIRGILAGMYGEEAPWSRDTIAMYIGAMHVIRPFMPPFPGSEDEKRALAAYLVQLRDHREVLDGAQDSGVDAPPRPPRRPDGTLERAL